MTDPTAKPPRTSEASEPVPPAESQPHVTAAESYQPPKLRRLGTLLELTQSGQGARTEAFRGSR
jgi:hypothetical protein